ncbi:DedA family protein [Paenibacillus sp. J2TS4]|uniref:DedA family protein n=1 Tax=Paenibacillus sp. J2TS4 TaxID=2807194 RepID=UPI001B0C5500|nr:DedA family protein [Paenibacillus sp. J2TS4]GIP31952.1 alkaline phosphatase [Paenibacillus sp. J2TS4]
MQWFEQYGYWLLFFGLLLEYVALPFPGETVMTYAGFLSYSGRIYWSVAVLISAAGTMIGITITYWIGRCFGTVFFDKYGKYIFLPPAKLKRAGGWFHKYGNKILFIAYFIPGVRHFTGYFSGILKLPFRTFAMYAYSGAIFWVLTFLTLGHLLGPNWDALHRLASTPMAKLVLLTASLGIAAWTGFKYRKSIFIFITEGTRWISHRANDLTKFHWAYPMTEAMLLLATGSFYIR